MSSDSAKKIVQNMWMQFSDSSGNPTQADKEEVLSRVDASYPLFSEYLASEGGVNERFLDNDIADLAFHYILPVMRSSVRDVDYLKRVEEKQKQRIKAKKKLNKAKELLNEVMDHLESVERYSLDGNEKQNVYSAIRELEFLMDRKLSSFNKKAINRRKIDPMSVAIEEINRRLVKYSLKSIPDGTKDRVAGTKLTGFGSALESLFGEGAAIAQNRFKDRKRK